MIREMTLANMSDYAKPNEGFVVFGRIIPRYENDMWTYSEKLISEPYIKTYDNDEIDTSYTGGNEKAVFLYYSDNDCVGRIRIRANWNGYVQVENIGIRREWRQCGIGTELIKKAMEWAKQNNFGGLMLETQDVNVSACRFYAKNGFVLGGVDNMLYSQSPSANEVALFWYRKL